MNQRTNRRAFLESAAAISAATALPKWYVDECLGEASQTNANADRRAIALIGCGGRGRGVAEQAARFGRVTTVCDVDDRQLALAKEIWPDAATEKDFRRVVARKDIDVVVCGTVDHWHALVSSAAMRAGKDVYCEKPLTLTIDEGRQLVQVTRETGRILQTGSQQRSDARFRLACELVRNGRIGKMKHVDVFLPAGRREGPFESAPVPEGFDWDMWQGPTPSVDYVEARTHVTFRYWWAYSGGTMTDWGAHHNDITLWGLGHDRSGPVSIKGQSRRAMIPGGFTAASEYRVEYTYADGVTHTCQSTAANAWNGRVIDPDGQQHGLRFEGEDGWIWVTRGAIEASNPELLTEPLGASAARLPRSDDHMANFFDCVETRRRPICDVEIGHRSATVCHLGVIAMRLGRTLRWNPATESIEGDPEAANWLGRESRGDWS